MNPVFDEAFKEGYNQGYGGRTPQIVPPEIPEGCEILPIKFHKMWVTHYMKGWEAGYRLYEIQGDDIPWGEPDTQEQA